MSQGALEDAVISRTSAGFDLEAFIYHLKDGGTGKKYKRGEKIFVQGEAAATVFFIRSGRVQLTVVSGRGREVVIGILESKAFFGEGSLSGQPLRIATATAMTASSLIRIRKDAMLRLLREKPEFAEGFLAYVLGRNARIEEDLVDQLLNSSEKR